MKVIVILMFLAAVLVAVGFGFLVAHSVLTEGYVIAKIDSPAYYEPVQECHFVINVNHCHDTGEMVRIDETFRIDISSCTLDEVLNQWIKRQFLCRYNIFYVSQDVFHKAQLGKYIEMR